MNDINDTAEKRIRMRVRFDFRGISTPGHLFVKGKDGEQIAEEIREQRAILFRNIPVQGVHVEEINTNCEIYLVHDESTGREIAYAPIEVIISAESVEEVIPFVLREEFRKLEVIAPAEVTLDKCAIERLIYKVNEELLTYQLMMEKRNNSR
jgi:hypothetical protein